MPNIRPIAVIKATPTELTLPDNKITLDGSGSHDPNTHGFVINYKFLQDGNVIADSDKPIAVVNYDKSGSPEFKLIVRDKGGLESRETTDSVAKVTVHPAKSKTVWGLQPQGKGTADSIAIIKSLGGTAIRTSLSVQDYNGRLTSAREYFNAGFTNLMNLGWNPQKDKFVSKAELTQYRVQLAKILTDLAPYRKKIIVLCENEPTNSSDEYFHDLIETYIAQFKVFGEVCKEHVFEFADGGTHVPYLVSLARGSRISDNAKKVQLILDSMKSVGNTYANIHFNNVGGETFNPADIKVAVDYIKKVTGLDTISNEWHTEQAKSGVIKYIIQGCRDAGLIISCGFSGNQFKAGKADSLTKQGSNELNDYGIEFRDAIASPIASEKPKVT